MYRPSPTLISKLADSFPRRLFVTVATTDPFSEVSTGDPFCELSQRSGSVNDRLLSQKLLAKHHTYKSPSPRRAVRTAVATTFCRRMSGAGVSRTAC